MKRYRLVEANYNWYANKYLIEDQIALQEGVVNWLKTSLSVLSGKRIDVDWKKVEGVFGGPVPEEVKVRVEKYLGGKTFKFQKFLMILLTIFSIGGVAWAINHGLSAKFDVTQYISDVSGIVSILGALATTLAAIVVKKLSESQLYSTGIHKYDKGEKWYSNSNVEYRLGDAYDAIVSSLQIKNEPGENRVFSKSLWLLIVAFMVCVIARVSIGVAAHVAGNPVAYII